MSEPESVCADGALGMDQTAGGKLVLDWIGKWDGGWF